MSEITVKMSEQEFTQWREFKKLDLLKIKSSVFMSFNYKPSYNVSSLFIGSKPVFMYQVYFYDEQNTAQFIQESLKSKDEHINRLESNNLDLVNRFNQMQIKSSNDMVVNQFENANIFERIWIAIKGEL